MNTKKHQLLSRTTLAALLLSPTIASGVVLLSEDFAGTTGAIDSLSGVADDTSGVVWATNGFATDNGVLQVGQLEGSALLAFTPTIGTMYSLTLDVTSASAEWLGFGFSRLATVGTNNNDPGSRYSNNTRGIAWGLYRPEENAGTTPINDQVQLFGGNGTSNGIADNNTDFSNGGVAVTRTLQVILDTATDQANFLIDGVSVSSGFQSIGTTSSAIQGVGFTWEGPTINGGTGSPITVDNFQLEAIPEPSTALLGALGALGLLRRRRA